MASVQQVKIIEFTNAAVEQVTSLLAQDEHKFLRLRLTGGGCSGFQYHFQLEQEALADDQIFEERGAAFVVDAQSLPLLQGGVVDFEEGLQGARFVYKNPQATSTCGCGTSFSV